MYRWLIPRIGYRAAMAVTAVWYAVLVLLIILFAAEPSVEFRYDDL
jgi:hypothetical protein